MHVYTPQRSISAYSPLTRWRPSIFIMHPPPSNTVPKVHARFPRKQHLDRLISRDEHTQRASETTPLQVLVYSASQMHLCGLIIERPDNHYKITERPVNLIVIIPFQLIISCTCKMPPHWHSIKCNFCSGPNSRGAEISRVFCVKAACCSAAKNNINFR